MRLQHSGQGQSSQAATRDLEPPRRERRWGEPAAAAWRERQGRREERRHAIQSHKSYVHAPAMGGRFARGVRGVTSWSAGWRLGDAVRAATSTGSPIGTGSAPHSMVQAVLAHAGGRRQRPPLLLAPSAPWPGALPLNPLHPAVHAVSLWLEYHCALRGRAGACTLSACRHCRRRGGSAHRWQGCRCHESESRVYRDTRQRASTQPGQPLTTAAAF